MDWSHKIKELRFLENLKQDALAQQLGVSQASVSQWERGVALPPPHVRAKLRQRLLSSPGERLRNAIRSSVVNSPNLCGLLALRDGDIVLDLLSHASYALFPLLSPADLGGRLRGKLGPGVDRMLDRLIEEGAFVGRLASATIAVSAERGGREASGIVTFTPFCNDDQGCALRAEVRLLGPGEPRPELEQFTQILREDAQAPLAGVRRTE